MWREFEYFKSMYYYYLNILPLFLYKMCVYHKAPECFLLVAAHLQESEQCFDDLKQMRLRLPLTFQLVRG